jgi:hypothetical protein
MKDFLFGKLKTYLILADGSEYSVVGRRYSHKNGILTVKDCFQSVATFVTFKNIIEK